MNRFLRDISMQQDFLGRGMRKTRSNNITNRRGAASGFDSDSDADADSSKQYDIDDDETYTCGKPRKCEPPVLLEIMPKFPEKDGSVHHYLLHEFCEVQQLDLKELQKSTLFLEDGDVFLHCYGHSLFSDLTGSPDLNSDNRVTCSVMARLSSLYAQILSAKKGGEPIAIEEKEKEKDVGGDECIDCIVDDCVDDDDGGGDGTKRKESKTKTKSKKKNKGKRRGHRKKARNQERERETTANKQMDVRLSPSYVLQLFKSRQQMHFRIWGLT
jgi:hypothetical protein